MTYYRQNSSTLSSLAEPRSQPAEEIYQKTVNNGQIKISSRLQPSTLLPLNAFSIRPCCKAYRDYRIFPSRRVLRSATFTSLTLHSLTSFSNMQLVREDPMLSKKSKTPGLSSKILKGLALLLEQKALLLSQPDVAKRNLMFFVSLELY